MLWARASMLVAATVVVGCEAIAGYDSESTGAGFSAAACVNAEEDPSNCGACGNPCRSDQDCVSGSCRCRPRLSSCNGACVDQKTDPRNCGSCGKTCKSSEVCVGGSCTSWSVLCRNTKCPIDGVGTACVDTKTAPLDCGGCGIVCATNQLCVDSACRAYAPAGSCKQCPCAECGAGSKCCSPPSGHETAICVEGSSCP
ncbi:MAG: hypothetical protein ACXVEF_33650 [Polyangiales bacterium]